MTIPRLALCVPPTGPEPTAAGLALIAGLAEAGLRVQHFRAWACPTRAEVVGQASGRLGRHLDAWLMPPDVCRSVFASGANGADLSIVEGSLAPAGEDLRSYPDPATEPLDLIDLGRPGDLAPLVKFLDLPTVAVIPCPRWEDLYLPRLSPGIDAVLIDQLESAGDFERIASAVRYILGKPVLGAVEALPELRRELAETPKAEPVDESIIEALGRSFRRFADFKAIKGLAKSRPFPAEAAIGREECRPAFRVAYAQDEAFGGYFPDTLETLEALGAELVEFSPLRSEALPDDADLVMIGCGFPDRFSDALSANFCLVEAIRSHVYQGRRLYSEGGGTAYLSRSYRFDGREVPGVGILPIDCILRDVPLSPYPALIRFCCDTWVAPVGTEVRGYNAGRWDVKPAAELSHCGTKSGPLAEGLDLVYHRNAIGSLIHLHFAALPQVVGAFAGRHSPTPLGR